MICLQKSLSSSVLLALCCIWASPGWAAEIHDAVRAGDLARVRALVAGNPRVLDARDERDRTPLHVASDAGRPEIAVFLITSGADLEVTDDLGQTPLHVAASGGHGPIVDRLIAGGADTKAVCRDGRTLLHSAASGGLVDLMARLVEAGFRVDARDRYGRTPLIKAAEAGSDAAAELLLSRGASVAVRSDYGQTALHEAAFSNNVRLLDLLVARGAEIDAVNDGGSTPLLFVSQAGRTEAIERLLAHGARLDVRNKWNETALSWPLGNGFQALVERLWPRAEALGDKALIQQYPLHRSAYHGNAEAAAFLLAKGVPVETEDDMGGTALQRAAQGGNVELARMLIERGARLDTLDARGSTLLHLAAKKGRTDMVRFLLQAGVDPRPTNRDDRNVLDVAREYAYPDIVRILDAAGVKPSPAAATRDVAALLARRLERGEAIVWSLGHCGFAVRTRTRLLIFDYFSRGPAPETPSLANGFVNPDEIKDLEVVVFVSHAHGDHFDPAILSWRQIVKSITYVFGWNARQGERTIEMVEPRAVRTIREMEIFTVNDEHDTVPEVAYLVKVDGLSIYHAGDYVGPIEGRRADMDYLRGRAGTVDLAFLQRFTQAESLRPTVVFPTHAADREYMYGAFAREAAARQLPSVVICPENKGDRYEYSGTVAAPAGRRDP